MNETELKGKFCKQLYDVWCNPYWNGIDHEACADCAGVEEA
ncbi:hypothetical protein PBI_STANNES_86 [Mycobacterium phage StAnnes]|nr:hypothetical protein PBI_STANNES_86 [Mycobacterium phage StAnnes]